MILGLVVCRGAGRGVDRLTFKDVVKAADELPSADAKPEYIDITATLMSIDPTQSLYYNACPDNNRKVAVPPLCPAHCFQPVVTDVAMCHWAIGRRGSPSLCLFSCGG